MYIFYMLRHFYRLQQGCEKILKNGSHVFSAEPASACTSLATKNVGIDGQKRAVDHVSPPSVQTGTNLQTAAEEISPESEPPLQKRAKRGVEEEEPEEGEILDSSDEEEMLERNQAESIPLENNTSVNDMKNMQHDVN